MRSIRINFDYEVNQFNWDHNQIVSIPDGESVFLE